MSNAEIERDWGQFLVNAADEQCQANRGYCLIDPAECRLIAEHINSQSTEISRLRTALKNWETDEQFERDYGIPEKIREQAAEISRLQALVDERGQRLEKMYEYLADMADWKGSGFVDLYPEASGWFDGEGNAK